VDGDSGLSAPAAHGTDAQLSHGHTVLAADRERFVPGHQAHRHRALTFEPQWTDQADGRTLPSFVTDELHDFLDCGADCPACSIRRHQDQKTSGKPALAPLANAL
jgi:hypothetical protein